MESKKEICEGCRELRKTRVYGTFNPRKRHLKHNLCARCANTPQSIVYDRMNRLR